MNRLPVLKALVVDSDSDRLDAITRVLAYGYPVLAVGGEEDALRIADAVKPDIIVLSAIPPNEKNAIATLRKLKDNPSTQRIPIIVLTVSQMQTADIKDSAATLRSSEAPSLRSTSLPARIPGQAGLISVLEAPVTSVRLCNEIERLIGRNFYCYATAKSDGCRTKHEEGSERLDSINPQGLTAFKLSKGSYGQSNLILGILPLHMPSVCKGKRRTPSSSLH